MPLSVQWDMNPAVVLDISGNATAVWSHSEAGGAVAIQTARVHRDIRSWSSPRTISVGGACYAPRLAVDGAGNVTAVWMRSLGATWLTQSAQWRAIGTGGANRPGGDVARRQRGDARVDAPVNGPTPTGFVLEGGAIPGSVMASLPTGSTARTVTLTAPDGVFFIRVHALLGSARSGPSNEIRVVVNVLSPPRPRRIS